MCMNTSYMRLEVLTVVLIGFTFLGCNGVLLGKGSSSFFTIKVVTDHLVQSFIRFAGASYTRYNIHSGTVGDR